MAGGRMEPGHEISITALPSWALNKTTAGFRLATKYFMGLVLSMC
jgi:hypothetical protein